MTSHVAFSCFLPKKMVRETRTIFSNHKNHNKVVFYFVVQRSQHYFAEPSIAMSTRRFGCKHAMTALDAEPGHVTVGWLEPTP